jgi:GrpB-like predicted nucleotidyltransferase (UPF0157 family)
MKKYVFREYDEKYPEYFKQEKEKLKKILGNVLIEHFGSTSVPGLGGKGIVDILVAVEKDNEIIKKAMRKLENAGYNYRPMGGSEDRWFFKKEHNGQWVHIHLTYDNSKSWKGNLRFRNYLRKHFAIKEEYAKIKKEGSIICEDDGEKYQAYKKSFIEKIEKKALK